MPTFMDIATEGSTRSWSLEPGNRLVKVIGPRRSGASGTLKSITGYFTQEKYLYGMTCVEMERALGLRPNELSQYANVYSLGRLPTASEFDYKFSAVFPDGKVFGKEKQEDFFNKRAEYLESGGRYHGAYDATIDEYPPGSAMIPQWTLKKDVEIKVGSLICSVTKLTPFPRPNGRVERYKPHNRGPVK